MESLSSSNISFEKKKSVQEPVDLCEDSGFSSISIGSNNSGKSIVKAEDADTTIGEGIEFADHSRIAEEQRLKQEKIKRKDPELLAQRRLAQEAYEKEIQEQQYKRLMHLLTKSKALSSFMQQKIEATSKRSVGRSKKKQDIDDIKNGDKEYLPPRLLRKRQNNDEENDSNDDLYTPSNKKSKQSNKNSKNQKGKKSNKKLNLSEEDIQEHLASMSDEESSDKENTKLNQNFVQPKYFIGELRDYQKVGVNWLKVLYENGMNGILADEMGLGKTIQVIALFAYLIEKQIPGPYMILVPLSTLANWISEFECFAPQLPVVVYYGSREERPSLRPNLTKKYRIGSYSTHPIVLMSYQIPYSDSSFLKQFNWRYIVVDEGQRIKNCDCQLFKILKTYNSVNRLLLTGTPLQNNLSELWSLLNFLLPEIFNNLDVFQAWFDAKKVQSEEGKQKFLQQEQEKHVFASLREILQPFMLRRLKEDVCPDIPPIKEVVIYTPLTTIQYDLYSAIINRDMGKLYKTKKENLIVDVDGKRPKRRCTQKITVDNLLDFYSTPVNIAKQNSEERQIEEWKEYANVTEENSQYLIRIRFGNDFVLYRHVVNHPYIIHSPMNDCGLRKVDEDLVKASGKLLVLDAMLKKLKSYGHKVLLFSTMTMVLDIIEDYLSLRDYEYVRLDGTINYLNRKNNIEKFQTDPEVFLFLLTTKAGAVGLNLAAADTVIIYDSDWNPQNDLQAMARCHRIGQTKPVVVYRLCTKGTVDEEMIKRASAKRFLEKAVISNEASLVNSEEGLSKLKTLLEENSYKVVDSKKQVYTEAELDDLLNRSDMVVPVTKEEAQD